MFVPLLPLIKEDAKLDLTFTEAAFLRSGFAGASAVLQVPFGFLAERTGEFWLLVGGNLWVAGGLVAMASVSGFALLLTIAFIAGLGGGTQHPLASGMVSRAYEEAGQATAVGTVNFAGDLGKMAAPAVALILATRHGWRATLRAVGLAGLAFMALSAPFRRSVQASKSENDGNDSGVVDDLRNGTHIGGFVALSGVGFLDSVTRGSALYLLPFVMIDNGIGEAQTFGLLVILLAGGAAGKFVCGWLNDRLGSVALIWGTKGLTALLVLASLATPPALMAPLLFAIGIGLNGTSSVLYATVATLVPPRRRARLYGVFYTTNEGGTVLGPLLYGRIADLLNLRAAIMGLALGTTLILPASLPLRRPLVEVTARTEQASG